MHTKILCNHASTDLHMILAWRLALFGFWRKASSTEINRSTEVRNIHSTTNWVGTERKTEGALHLGIYRQKQAAPVIRSIYVTFLQQISDIKSSFNNRTPSFKTSQILYDGSLIQISFNWVQFIDIKTRNFTREWSSGWFRVFCDYVITYFSDWAFFPKNWWTIPLSNMYLWVRYFSFFALDMSHQLDDQVLINRLWVREVGRVAISRSSGVPSMSWSTIQEWQSSKQQRRRMISHFHGSERSLEKLY